MRKHERKIYQINTDSFELAICSKRRLRKRDMERDWKMKALGDSYNIYTCVYTLLHVFGIQSENQEKRFWQAWLVHLWNPIEKPWKALLASVLRTKHRSERKESAKFHNEISHVLQFHFKKFRFFASIILKITNFDETIPKLIFHQILRKLSKCPRFPNFLIFSNKICWIFHKIVFEQLEKIDAKIYK